MSDFNRKYYEYLARLVTEDERDIDFICNRMASAYQKINDNSLIILEYAEHRGKDLRHLLMNVTERMDAVPSLIN